MENIEKISRRLIYVGPENPAIIAVPKGIDYFNTIIHISYPPAAIERKINLTFRTRGNESLSTPLTLGTLGGRTDYQLHSNLADRLNDFIFYELEVNSSVQITLDLWAEDQVGGFI